MPSHIKAKYSIILPVRNGGEYVKLCINSILSQTVKQFNLIVLDNCSSDGTLEYVSALSDDRIIIYPSSRPLTIEENWGRIPGIEANEFITLIGHDDILYPGYLAEMERLIEAYPEASLYQTHYAYVNHNGQLIRKCKPMREIEDGPSFLRSHLTFKIDVMGTGFMMRSADFKRLGGIPAYPNLVYGDLELWINLSDISFKATSSRECFSYRVHQSMTLTTSNLKFQQAFERFVYFLASLKQRNKEFADVIDRHGKRYLLFQCKALSRRLLQAPKTERDDLSINGLLQKFKQYSRLLGCDGDFKPTEFPTIFIAKVLDSNALGRFMFLVFEKVYSKLALK